MADWKWNDHNSHQKYTTIIRAYKEYGAQYTRTADTHQYDPFLDMQYGRQLQVADECMFITGSSIPNNSFKIIESKN